MEYGSFEEGMRALASHQTGDQAFFGSLEVGLKIQAGERLPYLQLANHALCLNDTEAATVNHIILDFERFPERIGKETMRLEFVKRGQDWKIMQSGPVKSYTMSDPRYTHAAELKSPGEYLDDVSATQQPSDVRFSLGNWRIGHLDIVKDNTSIGTVLNGERAYCGKEGMQNIPFLHESAFQR